MRRSILDALLLTAVAVVPAGADVTFQCPAPDSIRQITIPHSINCAYSAESDGIGFGGYNNCGLVGLPFVGAQAAETNGYWSLYCSYSNGSLGNVMSVGPDPVIETCEFAGAGGGQTCKGSLERCAVTCASKPGSTTDPGAAAELNERRTIGEHCAIFEFRDARIEAGPDPESATLVVTGEPPTPGMTIEVRPGTYTSRPVWWGYWVYYCWTAAPPPPGVQKVEVRLTPENVGSLGVEVIGDTLRQTLRVSFPESTRARGR